MVIPDRPIATDYSYEVLAARRLRGDVQTPALDSTNQRLVNVPSMLVQREAYFASREPNEDTNGRTA